MKKVYTVLYPPRKILLVYGEYEPKDIIKAINSRKDKYNICSVSDCCRGRIKSCGKINGEKLVWMYYDEYLLLSEDEVKDKIKIANKRLK